MGIGDDEQVFFSGYIQWCEFPSLIFGIKYFKITMSIIFYIQLYTKTLGGLGCISIWNIYSYIHSANVASDINMFSPLFKGKALFIGIRFYEHTDYRAGGNATHNIQIHGIAQMEKIISYER